MAVEVYCWQPKGNNVGHASIKVDGGAPPGSSYLSVWPGEALAIVFGKAAFNKYEDDVGSEGGQPLVARLTKLDETAIKAQMEIMRRSENYCFIAFNCATQASICLNAGVPGATVRRALDFLGGPLSFVFSPSIINTPWNLYAYAKLLEKSYA
ncbi:MAG: hypothetical protein M3033_08290 [Acidobacteriota bacterium]|nr:hypothetical protein [Acidobacteriota bacterium]